MMPESRDRKGRLRVGYFIASGEVFKAKKGYYDSGEFKLQIEKSGVLRDEDWHSDGKHKYTWRHRVDRATQRILTGI
jgi:hypothetical protein